MIDYKTTSVGQPSQRGLYVAAVSHGNSFQIGDRIVAVNGAGVATCGQMREIIGACHAGDVVHVTALRSGEPTDIPVTLTEADVPAIDEAANAH